LGTIYKNIRKNKKIEEGGIVGLGEFWPCPRAFHVYIVIKNYEANYSKYNQITCNSNDDSPN